LKKIQAVILGYGDRAFCYSEYAFDEPNELEIIGVIDFNKFKLEEAKKRFSLKDEQLFNSLDEFLAKNIKCDVVINSTMDQYHYETTRKLLIAKYNILLEKPITGNPKELLELEDLAIKNNCKVVVCHVLRYTPFYKKVKEIISSGELGKIINMELNEHVWYGHFVNAYVRGKWRNEKECGSGFLLAKCCHDTDLMCWLNNSTKPSEVASFGKRAFFIKDNAPKGHTKYCYDCPNKDKCLFNAYTFELEMDAIPQYTWIRIDKPLDKITKEEKIEYLKKDTFGTCVFDNDMDIVDRQSVVVNFENGSTGTLNMVAGASKAGRHIHVVCEYGEVIGYLEEGIIKLIRFNKKVNLAPISDDNPCYKEEIIDINKLVQRESNSTHGHNGGDYGIMHDLVRFLNEKEASVSTTVISDSVNSHLICFAAEESRKNHNVVDVAKSFPRKKL